MALTKATFSMIDGAAQSVVDYGADSTGVADSTSAIQNAWAVNKNIYFPKGTYLVTDLVLDGGGDYTKKQIVGNGTTITGDNVYIKQMFNLEASNFTISNTTNIYIEGARYGNWSDISFVGPVYWGKYASTLSSWSTYWMKLNRCSFGGGIEFTTSVTNANFNSNTFDTCEFRAGSAVALMTFKETATNDGVFSSNTFIGCDMSYAPVLYIVTNYDYFAMTVIGGYLDTGTDWYYTGSYKAKTLDVVGLRNPSGTTLDTTLSGDLRITSGGVRPKRSLPVGSISYFLGNTTHIGAIPQTITSQPLPVTGTYSISAFMVKNAGNLDGATFNNVTQAASLSNVLNADGYSSYTFSANAGDIVNIVLDGDASADIDVEFLELTLGAGVYSAFRQNEVRGIPTTVTCNNGVAENLVTLTQGAYDLNFYHVEVFTKTTVTGGGGAKIVLEVAHATSSSGSAVTITEVSRTAVNGLGGTSDDAGTLTITTSTSGLSVTLIGTLSGTPSAATVTIRVYAARNASSI